VSRRRILGPLPDNRLGGNGGTWDTITASEEPTSMLVYLRTDLFQSPAQTLVNTVNTVGVMGKGIAKTFKQRYPEMFREYKICCDRGELRVGTLLLWRGPERWVLNFPTKTTWRQPSRLDYIEQGLVRFVENYTQLGIHSISFPPLGCGNGQLAWDAVRPVMEKHLKNVRIPVYIHDRQVSPDHVPAHEEAAAQEPPVPVHGTGEVTALDRDEDGLAQPR